MNSTFFTSSRKKNSYLVNLQKKSILFVHPLIPAIYYDDKQTYSNFSDIELDYYYRKLMYFRKYNLISDYLDIVCKPFEITPQMVEESIANTNQVVFETTQRCNLKCKYCFYEDFYDTRINNEHVDLTSEKAYKVIEYIIDKLSSFNNSSDTTIYMSFYGGEPLLNTVLISDTIDYCKKIDKNLRIPKYTITTNGTLLNKHIKLLVDNNFRIYVTLDGNKNNNSYRTYPNKANSFNSIMSNLTLVKEKYPDYFKQNILFNAVLHNRNSVNDIHNFFKENFDKRPTILELNNSGIKESKKEEFNEMFHSKIEDIQHLNTCKDDDFDMTMRNPIYNSVALFLNQYLWFVYKTYRHQLIREKKEYQLSTGTCIPFSKKIFITADGKILPCEKISHDHALGFVTKKGVSIDCQAIAEKYNKLIKQLSRQCQTCYKLFACKQCLFFVDKNNPVCYAYMNGLGFANYIQSMISFVEEHPKEYHVIMSEVLFN